MSRYAALAKRVARAEQAATRSKRRFPRMTFAISDAPEATVQGFANADGLMVAREPGEALPDALRRAWSHPDAGLFLFAVYPPDEDPEAAPGQIVPPEPEPTPDPFALAGIGRVDEKYLGHWQAKGEPG